MQGFSQDIMRMGFQKKRLAEGAQSRWKVNERVYRSSLAVIPLHERAVVEDISTVSYNKNL